MTIWASSGLLHLIFFNKNLFYFQTKKYADVIIPRGADNLGEIFFQMF